MPTHLHEAGAPAFLNLQTLVKAVTFFSASPNIPMSIKSELEKFSLQVKFQFGKLRSRTAVTLTQ